MLITYLISFYTFLHAHTIINTYMSRRVCVCVCTCRGVFLAWLVLQHCVCLLSQVQFFPTPWALAHQAPLSMGFPGKNTGVSCHFFLQGIFQTQGSNPRLLSLLHWQAGSYQLCHLFCRGGVISHAHFCFFLSLLLQCFFNIPVWWAFGK